MKNQIQNWLNKPDDYATGLALYNAVKINLKHDKFLAGVHPKNSMQHKLLVSMLTREMAKIVMNPDLNRAVPYELKATQTKIAVRPNPIKPTNEAPQAPQAIVLPDACEKEDVGLPKSSKPRFVHNDLIEVSSLPAELQEVYFGIKEKYKEQARIHDLMIDTKATDDDRKTYLQKIIKADNEIREAWQQLDDYAKNPDSGVENKKMPSPEPEVARKIKHLKNLKDYVARETKNIDKPNTSAKSREKKQARINRWLQEIKTISDELGV